MDLYDILLQAGLITSALVLYLIYIRRPTNKSGPYREKEWNYIIKYIFARIAVRRWKTKFPSKFVVSEKSKEGLTEGWDGISIRTSATDGTTVLLGIRKICGRKPMAEVNLYVKLVDGTSYKLPSYPETLVVQWETIEDGWSAGGLKVQILEPEQRLRILYNGLLRNSVDNTIQHVRLNLIWCSATSVVRHPADWSEQLAAHALALETWRDGSWAQILSKFDHNSWLQFGAAQGTLQTFDEEGALQKRERLRMRGVRERGWSRDVCPRRALTLTAVAKDGTAIMLRGLSYKNIFNELISGCVRFPDYTIKPLTATDLIMSEFCETPDGIPKVYTITAVANGRSLKVVLRINDDGVKVISLTPQKQDIVYRTLAVEINGEHGTGILELTYESSDKTPIPQQASQTHFLKWLNEDKAGSVGNCLSFEDSAAACPAYVGGKGASLALLASVQNDEGYKVPPGFCLTTKALERQLEVYPELIQAIKGIEAANEDYDEDIFKQKCEITVELFMKTDISEDIKEEILKYLNDLRMKIKEQNFSIEERFAVRSSGVGEDSEATSAAGQNETVLGCVGDADVLRAVRRCWASMFAFNSSYYRRQNGQPCSCGGGVVVQALASARVAGVLFTRHPLGDPSRLLITANYGLGESVVSGSVEPDSIIVKRETNGLRISKIDLGSKKERVKPDGDGVSVETVSDEEQKVPCLTVSEILKLAKLGVSQEELWGAGRDIEWAINDDVIYLLQARPITSLERWTEEELLHELDFPIMSDDELLTFANTGEVLPKPLTPMTYDLVVTPLQKGIDGVIGCNGDHYDRSIAVTHNRCALVLYNSVYRRMPPKIDIGIRMVEMAVHGHKVADDNIVSTALHRRRPHFLDRVLTMASMFKSVLFAKSTMNDTIKRVNEMNLEIETNDPLEYLNRLVAGLSERMQVYSANHSHTSSASTFTQFIAMSILLEGKEDFTPEHCSEIGVLLSSGDVLSAQVPLALADITRELEDSGKAQEFRVLEPSDAMTWLRKNLPHVHMDICQFLEQHGHRAIMEFDLATKPWALVPEEFIKVLQTMPATKDASKIIKSNAEIIASLKTPQKPSTRKALRWVLPLCHRSVRHREGTKAHLILAIHKLRLSILNLAKLLVRQWYLPHPDLIFFFRVNELRAYIEKRNPAILRKAIQRQQLYPGWCKLKFAEVNTGWFDPLPTAGPAVTAGDVTIHATSVCGGEVVGRACVVKDLSEISELQSGDILITHSTDIGWSPYFPLLSGIVTELGGLISHGAVIAREYGLPCIVGATNATSAFATGDTVRLCATTGTVQRVHLHTADTVADE
ncbi:putative phosphoenolpyruvate synthase [Papilio machaon]|uniref:Putative phosphoenolpyruvate synthase n=1 Tax=Papilio machaon TaxID=76193 RepID=A0A194QV09_PAPMA|nr:putative phosphoenolpyruvate synthase [Papilio machaon]